VPRSRYAPNENLRKSYSDLKWLLSDLVHKHLMNVSERTRNGSRHQVAKVEARHNRVTIPQVIRDYAKEKGEDLPYKMQLTWVVCYLHHIRPDTTQNGWEYFECSHRCISYNLPVGVECIDKKCLIFESKKVNQSRGHASSYCCKKCTHCGDYICKCQSLHFPCCL